VADFAPHDLEFLRDEYAHQRLGFDEAQMAGWICDAGLKPTEHRSLKPDRQAGSKLTVSLWLSERTAAEIGRRDEPLGRTLEHAS